MASVIIPDYQLTWYERAEELAAEMARIQSTDRKLEALRQFVASHDPGKDAWVDDAVTPPVVRWTGYTGAGEPFQCAASNFREARQELGY